MFILGGGGEKKERETYIHTLSSLEMIMQMVEKLWPILPTSCACTLGKKSGTKLHAALPLVYMLSPT